MADPIRASAASAAVLVVITAPAGTPPAEVESTAGFALEEWRAQAEKETRRG
jgi:hypothetical protein